MINIQRKEDCVGCGACSDICSKNAIVFNTDNEGFWYPVVETNKCVDCGLCEKVCPIINSISLNKTNGDEPQVFAAYHNNPNTRFFSTTGGLFSALAEQMLSLNGYIGGAVWTEDFGAKHILSNQEKDLTRIRGSKYFQSETFGIYKQLKKLLVEGNKVLICGCPCQMAAVRSYLRKDYENLILVDFICSNICSPKVFQKYKEHLETVYNAKMISYHPKNKEYGGWHHFAFKAVFENGKIYHRSGTDDDFTHLFIGSHVAARPCCFECHFKKIPRVADITIADFWGIDRINPAMDSPNGTSVVILNNDKGQFFYETIRHRITDNKQTIKEAISGNLNLVKSVPVSSVDRNKFYSMLNEDGGFEKAVTYSRSFKTTVPFIIRIKQILKKYVPIK